MVSTLVRMEGREPLEVTVPGRLLPLVPPQGMDVRVSRSATPQVVLRSTDPFATFVGRFPLPYVESDGTVDVSFLDVPPSEPWTADDVQVMWSTLLAHGLTPTASRLGGQANVGIPEYQREPEGLEWLALNACNTTSRRLLSRWPMASATRRVLVAPETPRGVELITSTEVLLGTRIDLITTPSSRLLPERTLRRVSDSRVWQARALALVAALVVRSARRRAEQTEVGELPPHLVDALERVGRLANPQRGDVDLPMSSWPPSFVFLYHSCVSALVELQSQEPGEDWVPLADLWRIYEAWVAVQVFNLLRNRFGEGIPIEGEAARVARQWEIGHVKLQMWHPCTFGPKRRLLGGAAWSSVSSELEPDIILVAQADDQTRLAVIDPKNRPVLRSGDLAVEASKYLWGIRSSGTFPSVSHVALVAPLGGVQAYNPGVSRMEVVAAMPDRDGLPPQRGRGLSDAVDDILGSHLMVC